MDPIAAAQVRAEMNLEGIGDAVDIHCPSCEFVANGYAQFSIHALNHLRDRPPPRPAADHAPLRRPPPFKRPTIGTCCKPADWANFMAAWERYRVGSNIQDDSVIYEFIECLSELHTVATHAHPDILTLGLDEVVHLSK